MAEKRRIQDAGTAVGFADQPQPETGTVCRRGSGDRQDPARKTRLPVSLYATTAATSAGNGPTIRSSKRTISPAYRAVERAAPKDLMIEDEQRSRRAEQRSASPVRSRYRVTTHIDRGEPTKQSRKKKRDLREFSKWIALKKRMRDKPGEG